MHVARRREQALVEAAACGAGDDAVEPAEKHPPQLFLPDRGQVE